MPASTMRCVASRTPLAGRAKPARSARGPGRCSHALRIAHLQRRHRPEPVVEERGQAARVHLLIQGDEARARLAACTIVA
jgi:hypothetical protein